MRHEAEEAPFAFLSSRIDTLEDLRAAIRAACARAGIDIWAADLREEQEPDQPDKRATSLWQTAERCVERVSKAEAIVLLLEGSYGGTASPELGDLSILELEVALAAISEKPIYAYEMAKHDDDGRLVSLLKTLQHAHVVTQPTMIDPAQLPTAIAVRLANQRRRRAATLARESRLVVRLARWLDPRLTDVEREIADPAAPLLFSLISPLPAASANLERARALLVEAEHLAHTRQQQVLKLWMALRHLAAMPWTRTDEPPVLDTWLSFLAQWDRATAWLGVNTGKFLSRLAAQRERREVWLRLRHAAPEMARHEPSIGTEGASASLLYSIANRQRSLFARRRLRRRALETIDAAIESNAATDVSGLLSTRAYIRLRLGHPFLAKRDSARALELRQAAGESDGRVGESEATHGWMLTACLRPGQGLVFLQRGVDKLHRSDQVEFTARAMRQLGVALAFRSRWREAEAIWEDADRLAETAQLHDQTRQLRPLLDRARRLRRTGRSVIDVITSCLK